MSATTDFQSNLKRFASTVAVALNKLAIASSAIKSAQIPNEIEQVKNFAFALVQAVNNGGTTTIINNSVIASVAVRNTSAAVSNVALFSTPNDGVNHVYRISIYMSQISGGGTNVTFETLFNDPEDNNLGFIVGNLNLGGVNHVATGTLTFTVTPNSSIKYSLLYAGPGNYSYWAELELLN